MAHYSLDLGHGFGCGGGDHLAAAGRYQHVVFNADTDIPQSLRHVVGGADVTAGLDGEGHAGL